MSTHGLENIEIELLIEAVKRRYGFDFGNYARASLRRRLAAFLIKRDETCIGELIPKILRDPNLFSSLVTAISVPVSELFRNPDVFLNLRQNVLPLLGTYPRINIWQAGCATGEETYTLAILLHEAGLLEKTRIYATDINEEALLMAEEGVYPEAVANDGEKNYLKAGGTGRLSDFYRAQYGHVKFDHELSKNVIFAQHNLASDNVFCEAHLAICRNVLIYFNRQLQNRVLQLFRDSLVFRGFLCLGNRETLSHSPVEHQFEAINQDLRIFRLASGAQG